MRHGCFELKTTCGHCSNPMPVNGPIRELPCPTCTKPRRIAADIVSGMCADLEEEYENYEDREGSGGTMMTGSGTFEYRYFRLEPRCEECKIPLPEVQTGTEGKIACTECGKAFHTWPAPDWLIEDVPSATQCLATQLEGAAADPGKQTELVPIGMNCPQCGGGLKLTAQDERVSNCQFCSGEFMIPDPIWHRLHPVRVAEEWFVRFEGLNPVEMAKSRRVQDLREEKAAMKKWRAPKKRRSSVLKYTLIAAAILIPLGLVAALVVGGVVAVGLFLAGIDLAAVTAAVGAGMSTVGAGVVFALIATVTIWGAMGTNFAFWFGRTGKCKKELIRIADVNGWTVSGVEHSQYMGSIREEIKGRDIEIDPDSDYAIEIDIDDRPFYLKTEMPAWMGDDLQRFTTGDSRFDQIFPIRYIKPKHEKKLEALKVPIDWFLDRWGDKLARMKIDGSVDVHLAPGGMGEDKWVYADELEPLYQDTLALAVDIDRVMRGKQPLTATE